MQQNTDDVVLINQLKDGSKTAFEKLYYKYSGKLFNTISLLLYDKTIAKDITQSCFMIIWEKRSVIDADKNFAAFLYTIAKNLVYKETERLILNKKYVESRQINAEKNEEKTIDDLNQTFIEQQLNKLIDELSPTPKEIFTLKYEQELSIKKIAAQLDLTERSVEAHLYRTMKHLKEKFRKSQ